MRIPLVKTATDRQLLGATLDWRPRQLEMLELFGRDDLDLVVAACGREGGKTSGATATAIWGATMRDDLDAMMRRGQTRNTLIVAPREDQARELIDVATSMVLASPLLAPLASVKAGRIDFNLPSGARSAIRALPASPRSIRGMTASLCIIDEVAHLNSDDGGEVTDVKLIEALQGSMSNFEPDGLSKLVLISTPLGQAGRFYELFVSAQDGTIPRSAALHLPAWLLNPALDTEEWKESKRRLLGVDGFDQEHGASFISGAGAFMDLRDVRWADGPVSPEEGKGWVAGLDPAWSNDRFGVALVGESVDEPGLFVVGEVAGIEGVQSRSFDEMRARQDVTLEQVWSIVEPYRPRIVTDQYQAPAISSFLGRRGLGVGVQNLTLPVKAAAFASLRTRLMDGSLRCWRHPWLVEELRRVRARPGSEAIDLPRFGGGHCDVAMALAQAVFALRGVQGWPDGRVRHGGGMKVNRAMVGLDPPARVRSGALQQSGPPAGWPGEPGGIMGERF